MKSHTEPDSITRSLELPVPPARAWDGFVRDFAKWWPREHCFCGEDALDHVFIDLDRGFWGEVTKSGETLPWGAVIAAEAPDSLTLGWQMDATVSPWIPEPEPGRASIVDIRFEPSGTGARITLTHRDFVRQGDRHAKAMRDVMIGMDRWADWLQDYAASLGG